MYNKKIPINIIILRAIFNRGNMEELIKELNIYYPNVKFTEGNENGHKILLYDKRELMWNSEFENRVLILAEKYLKEDEYNLFAYIYDKF